MEDKGPLGSVVTGSCALASLWVPGREPQLSTRVQVLLATALSLQPQEWSLNVIVYLSIWNGTGSLLYSISLGAKDVT